MVSRSKNNNENKQISDAIFHGVKMIMKRRVTPLTTTMTQLNETLMNNMNVPANWPGSASALRVALNKVLNRIRNSGVSVRFSRAPEHMRTRLVRFN
jgi:hypothetical protein